MRLGLVTRNVAPLANASKAHSNVIAKPLTPEEAKKLVEGLSRDRFRPLHLLMLFLGIRQGEALGLRWSDLDLVHSVCPVRVQLTLRESKYSLDDLKTERSRRDLPLSPFLIAMLRAHKEEQAAERKAIEDKDGMWGSEWDLAFTTPTGHPLHFSTVNPSSIASWSAWGSTRDASTICGTRPRRY